MPADRDSGAQRPGRKTRARRQLDNAVGSAADRGAGAAAREHGHDEAGEAHPPIHDRTKYHGVTAGWVGRRGSASGPPSTGAITGWAMAWAGSMRTSTARITPSSPASPRAGRQLHRLGPCPLVANDRLRYRPAFRVPPAVLRAGFLRLVLVDWHNVPLGLVRVQFGRCGVLLPPHTTHLLDQLITSTPSAG